MFEQYTSVFGQKLYKLLLLSFLTKIVNLLSRALEATFGVA